VFDTKETVLFVGGRGTKAGDANAGGGATEAAWLAGLAEDLTKVMGTNGEPLSDSAAWNGAQNACDVQQWGATGYVSLGKVGFPWMANCQIGNIVNVNFAAVYPDGRYEVLDKDDIFLKIDLTYSADTTCDLKCGGAFDLLQKAIDEKDADSYNVTIHRNKDFTFSIAGDTIDFTAGGGDVANNTFLTIHEFNTATGDMDEGGTYHQGPLDALKNGVDATKCVKIDANNLATDAVSIDNRDNIRFINTYFTNTNQASGNNLIEFATSPVNIHFVNCKFDDAFYFINGTNYNLYLDSCYWGNNYFGNYPCAFATYGKVFNCVFNADGKTYGPVMYYTHFTGCFFYKGTYGTYLPQGTFVHCIFYLQTGACIYTNGGTYYASGHSNIFYPAAVDDYAFLAGASGGTCSPDMVNCCVWSDAGQLTVDHVYSNKTSEGWDLPGAIEADPQFVDAGKFDFRLKLSSLCLHTGKSTLGAP